MRELPEPKFHIVGMPADTYIRNEVLAIQKQAYEDGLRDAIPEKLWLWQNFVNGRPEYWAFDNPFPIYMDSHDPQTLGEPCGYALFKQSRNARPDFPEERVLRAMLTASQKEQPQKRHACDDPLCAVCGNPL